MRAMPRDVGRSVDRGAGGPAIEPRNENSPGWRRFLWRGRQHGGVRYRACPAGPAWSETLARRRHLVSGNREVSWLAVSGRTVRIGKAGRPKPMMHGDEKSAPTIVAAKSAHKPGLPDAERMEPRVGAKGNTIGHGRHRTPSRESLSHGLDRVRQAAKDRKDERLTALLHHVDVELLRSAYGWLRKEASAGVDGVSWAAYGEGLEATLTDLHSRIHRGAYRAQPSRRV